MISNMLSRIGWLSVCMYDPQTDYKERFNIIKLVQLQQEERFKSSRKKWDYRTHQKNKRKQPKLNRRRSVPDQHSCHVGRSKTQSQSSCPVFIVFFASGENKKRKRKRTQDIMSQQHVHRMTSRGKRVTLFF